MTGAAEISAFSAIVFGVEVGSGASNAGSKGRGGRRGNGAATEMSAFTSLVEAHVAVSDGRAGRGEGGDDRVTNEISPLIAAVVIVAGAAEVGAVVVTLRGSISANPHCCELKSALPLNSKAEEADAAEKKIIRLVLINKNIFLKK